MSSQITHCTVYPQKDEGMNTNLSTVLSEPNEVFLDPLS